MKRRNLKQYRHVVIPCMHSIDREEAYPLCRQFGGKVCEDMESCPHYAVSRRQVGDFHRDMKAARHRESGRQEIELRKAIKGHVRNEDMPFKYKYQHI